MSKDQISIHPGVVNGRRKFGATTSTKPHKSKGKLAKKLRTLNLRQTACSRTRSAKSVNPSAFKMPGSMNQHKRV